MERRVIRKFHARCEVGEKPEIVSGAYLSLSEATEGDPGMATGVIAEWFKKVYEPAFSNN